MSRSKYKTIQPPKLGDTLSTYAGAGKVVKVHGMGTVDVEVRDGRWFRVTGLPICAIRVPA